MAQMRFDLTGFARGMQGSPIIREPALGLPGEAQQAQCDANVKLPRGSSHPVPGDEMMENDGCDARGPQRIQL